MNKNKIIIGLNIILPIFLGTLLYYFMSPNVIFVRMLDDVLGINLHIHIIFDGILCKLIRNYFLDMLWAYALLFAIYAFMNNDSAGLMKTFIIAVMFSVIMEVLQMTNFVYGTFDVFDIISEILALCFAAVIIYFVIIRRISDEKQK